MGITSEHFSDAELRCRGNDCGEVGCPINACTQDLVDALEAFRAAVGKPVLIDDAYRCQHHNGSTPNAVQHSEHVLGNAADIRVEGMTAAALEAIAETVSAIHGIGRDDFANYIHIDVRLNAAKWCYSVTGEVIPYYPSQSIPT